MLPAQNGDVYVCCRVCGEPLGTWGVGQALLRKHGLGDPERWWRVGWGQDWFFSGTAESAVASLSRTSY